MHPAYPWPAHPAAKNGLSFNGATLRFLFLIRSGVTALSRRRRRSYRPYFDPFGPKRFRLFLEMIDDHPAARNHQIRIFQQLEALERITLDRNQIGRRIRQ
jgi:hypothetical protein